VVDILDSYSWKREPERVICHHLDDVVKCWVLIAQEPGAEERVVPPAEVGHEEAE
jgi:hypothetical protein